MRLTTGMDASKRKKVKFLEIRLLIAMRFMEIAETDLRKKKKATNPELAWLGDALNYTYLAMIGVDHGLTPALMDGVRQKELSSKGLSDGMGRKVAGDVGSCEATCARTPSGPVCARALGGGRAKEIDHQVWD